jgi:hypothetical protein
MLPTLSGLGVPWQVAEKGILIVFAVIPAKAGIQCSKGSLDSRFRGSDGLIVFFSL